MRVRFAMSVVNCLDENPNRRGRVYRSSASSLYFVFILSILGCTGSSENQSQTDSGESGAGGGNASAFIGTSEIDGEAGGVGGKLIEPPDTGIASESLEASVSSDMGDTGGTRDDGGAWDTGVIEDSDGIGGSGDAEVEDGKGVADAPCSPNCPILTWITIPGGVFQMGSPPGVGDDLEYPRHEVTLPSFKILETEVTVSQYGKCVEFGPCSEPYSGGNLYNWGKDGRENHPMNAVGWNEAKAFAQWVGGRLPSEAEWEYAARSGGQDNLYPWGDEEASCKYAVIDDGVEGWGCGWGTTLQVCSRVSGNTAQGLCDIAGNVWEWVEDDWHDNYQGAPDDGSAWIDQPRSNRRGLRGGSWRYFPERCRSAARESDVFDIRDTYYGFRVVIDILGTE